MIQCHHKKEQSMKNLDSNKLSGGDHNHCCDENNKHSRHHDSCDCCHDDEFNEDDYMCDLDPTKICDNCCKCLDTFNTDEKGYVKIGIDKIDNNGLTVEELYEMYGLNDEDDDKH